MKGNAKVQTMGNKLFVYLPKQVVRLENIQAGNIIDYEIHNPYPDKIIEPKQGLNFHKNGKAKVKEEVAGEAPAVEINKDLPMTEEMFLKMYSVSNDVNLFNQAVDQFGAERVKELLHKNVG